MGLLSPDLLCYQKKKNNVMSNYFNIFPKIDYDISKSGITKNVVDLTVRYAIKTKIKNRSATYYNYIIKDGERPDTLANRFYDDSKLDWVVLMVNDIVDPLYDWPLNYQNFRNYLTKKYGSISEAQQGVHHYEQIVRTAGYQTSSAYEGYDEIGEPLKEIVVEVDSDTYTNLVATQPGTHRSVSNYDYEHKLNEDKREILVLDKYFLNKVISEVEDVFR